MTVLLSRFITLIAIVLSIGAQAQNTLVDRFGGEAIASIQGTEKLAILEFQNTHGYAVQDLSGFKDVSEYPDALEVLPVNEDGEPLSLEKISSGFELFAYQFPQAGKNNLYYRIGDSGVLLTIYSMKTVKRLYDQQ